MPQVTIYLDEETDALVRAAVRASGLSKSKWIAETLRTRVRGEWPPSVAALAGAWPDFPSAERLRRRRAKDASREPL